MKGTDQLVIERPNRQPVSAAHSAIRSILFVVHEDDQLDARFQAALSLARASSAHLHLVHVVPVQAYSVVDAYGGTFASGEIVEVLEQQAEEVRNRLEGHLTIEDVSWSYEVTVSAIVPELLKHAALSDLVVIGRSPPFHEFSRTGPGLLGEFLCSTRTPLCVPGDECSIFDPFGKALIAWNGSIESANAVRSTISLLSMASSVRVMRFSEGKEVALSDTRLLEYLSRHDVHAEFEAHLPREDIACDLLARAADAGSEYIVMGGYSHSRAGEFLFGGVTRELLRDCSISLVMAH